VLSAAWLLHSQWGWVLDIGRFEDGRLSLHW
jgi:hypothetical protein